MGGFGSDIGDVNIVKDVPCGDEGRVQGVRGQKTHFLIVIKLETFFDVDLARYLYFF